MDKYEFKISLNEINALIGEKRFEEAANIADGIDWNHVKSAETLCRISEVYKAVGDYDRSRDIMAIAHERETDNPVIVYALCELTIFLYGRDGLQSDLTQALQLMQEYQALEPKNPRRLILQYKMYCVSPVSDQEKIAVLEQLHAEKASARWDYELAVLYQKAGETRKASELGSSILRNFAGSKYAGMAEELLRKAPAAGGKEEKAAPAGQPAAPEESAKEAEEEAQAERTAEELERTAVEERAAEEAKAPLSEGPAAGAESGEEKPAEEIPAPVQEEHTDLPIRTAEEQHSVDSIQNNVAKGMQDIYARPYDDKLEQETNGQYSMVMDTPDEPEQQVDGQLSISEVMAEWEKIRSDIRRANDEKRAQRILEDTGSLMQDFDETARHGLLEDIEKGVARQRRQVRSGMYRMAGDLPARGPQPARAKAPAAEQPVRRTYRADDGFPAKPAGRGVPVSNEEDDTKVYGRRGGRNAMDEIATRRWNSEDIRRAMARQEALAREEEQAAYGGHEEPQQETYPDEKEERREAVPEETAAAAAGVTEEAKAPEEEAPETEEIRKPQPAVKAAPSETPEEVPAAEPEEEAPAEEYEEEQEETPAEEYEDEAPAPEYGEEQDEALAEAYEEEAPAEGYEEEPEEAPAEEPGEEVPAPGYEEEPEEAPAEEYEDEAPAPEYEEEQDEAPAEEYKDEAPAQEYEEETPAPEPEEERAETAPAQERNRPQRRPAPQEKPKTAPAAKAAPAPAEGSREAAKPAPGGKRELSREERRLFGPFCRMRENVEQLTAALDEISLASATGNLLILGNEATADRVAKGILEITRRTDSNFTGKVARVSGESLNRLKPEGIRKTFEKLESGALIINKAADIAPKTMERLYHELEGREHGIILILVDGNKKMEQFRHENEKYLGSFTATIAIRPLDDKALVAYARDYALSQDFSIDEFGQLALAQRIAAMQTSTHQVTLGEVRDLVDEAIGYAEKKTPHTLMEVLSRRRYDENDRIIIHEKDFMHN